MEVRGGHDVGDGTRVEVYQAVAHGGVGVGAGIGGG
jgi:hypothetical protein